jgi:hypothetical protein
MTAAVLGVAAGVGVMLLLRRGSRKRNPMMVAARRGMDGARSMGRTAARGARRGMERGRELLDELPVEEFGEELRDYLDAAKEAIEDTVRGELHDLQKTMRRQRRRMGI